MAAMGDSSFAAIQRYVEKTGIAQVLFSLMQQILENPLLPVNPFTLFDGPLRSHTEHLDIWAARSASATDAAFRENTIEAHPEDATIAMARGGPAPVWGLPQLVSLCDLASVARFKALASEFTLPDVEILRRAPSELVVAVGGPAMHPALHGGAGDVVFRVELFIVTDVDDAIAGFAAVVCADAMRWAAHPQHMLVDLTTGGPAGGTWTWLQLRTARLTVEESIAEATRDAFSVTARVLLQTQPGQQALATLVYTLHCDQSGELAQPCPEASIYHSVFFSEVDARRCFRLRAPASSDAAVRAYATELLDRAIATNRTQGWSSFVHQMFLYFALCGAGTSSGRELPTLLGDGVGVIGLALETGLLLRTIVGALMAAPAALPRPLRTLASRFVTMLTAVEACFDEERLACRATVRFCAAVCQRLESPAEVLSAVSLLTSMLALAGPIRLEDRLHWLPAISHTLKHRMAALQPPAAAPAAPAAPQRPNRGKSKIKAVKGKEEKQGAPPPLGTEGDTDSVYVDVTLAMQRSAAPAAIRREAVLTQYCADTRLDQVAHEALFDLLSGSSLPSNPYRALVSAFRLAGRRLVLCPQPATRLLETLTSGPAAPVKLSANSVLCTIPDSQLFGLRSALVAVDPTRLRAVASQVGMLRCATLPYRRGYRSAVHLALSGDCCLVGTFVNNVSEVDLVEFCTVAGPSRDESQLLFCQGVSEHLTDLLEHSQERNYIVLGVRAGSTLVPPAQFENSMGLRVALQAALQNRDLIQIELALFIERRYVLVKKSMLLRILTEAGPVALGPAALSSLLFECVFLSRDGTSDVLADMPMPETAAQHIESQICEAVSVGSLFQVYRLLLLRARVRSAFALLPFVWRMTHSAAQQCVYLNSVNRALRSLLRLIIDETLPLERVDAVRLTQMFLDFEAQTLALLRSESAFVSSSTCAAATAALQAVWLPGRSGLQVTKASLALLEFVSNLTIGLLVMAAEDVHRICPDVTSTLTALLASRAPSRR